MAETNAGQDDLDDMFAGDGPVKPAGEEQKNLQQADHPRPEVVEDELGKDMFGDEDQDDDMFGDDDKDKKDHGAAEGHPQEAGQGNPENDLDDMFGAPEDQVDHKAATDQAKAGVEQVEDEDVDMFG